MLEGRHSFISKTLPLHIEAENFREMSSKSETKGKTLEQLDAIFGDNSGKADRDRRERISARFAAEQLDRRSEDEK